MFLSLTPTGHKNVVLTLVERGGSARSFHIDSTSIADIAPNVRANIKRESDFVTDEARHYKEIGRGCEDHGAVKHSRDEYARREGDRLVSTNTVEGYYSIFRRGLTAA